MQKAVANLERGGVVSFTFGIEKLEKLTMLDEGIFKSRPDLELRLHRGTGRVGVRELETLTSMIHVRRLFLRAFGNKLDQLGEMKKLTSLRLTMTRKHSLSFVEYLKKLKAVHLFGQFNHLDSLSFCPQLRSVTLSTTIDSLSFFRSLKRIQSVAIYECRCTDDLRPLNHPTLRKLSLSSIRGLKDVSALQSFRSLHSLELGGKIEQLPNLKRLKNLKKLRLCYMSEWQNPEALRALANLEHLELRHINTQLKADRFFFLTEMPRLKTVDFCFIDCNKTRVKRLADHFRECGKLKLLDQELLRERLAV